MPAKLIPRTDTPCTCQAFCFEKSQHLFCYYWLCSPLGFALKYIIFGQQSLLGKRGSLLKILTCKIPSPDLWSLGWGAWHRPELEGPPPCPGAFPSPILWEVCGSVTSVSEWLCFLLQVAYALQDWWLAYWWVIPGLTQSAVKSTGTSLSHRVRGREGASSASSSDPHVVSLKKNESSCGGVWSPHGLSPTMCLPLATSSQTIFFSFFELLILYLEMADKQWCDSFFLIVKGHRHTYACIHSPPDFLSICHIAFSRVPCVIQ